MQNKSASLRESNVERKKRCRLQNKIKKKSASKKSSFCHWQISCIDSYWLRLAYTRHRHMHVPLSLSVYICGAHSQNAYLKRCMLKAWCDSANVHSFASSHFAFGRMHAAKLDLFWLNHTQHTLLCKCMDSDHCVPSLMQRVNANMLC